MRYFLELAYNGTKYSGWQIQHNAISVQQLVDEAIGKVVGKPTVSLGCGRTDTGVHATQFYIHFDVENKISDTAKFIFQTNAILPFDICVFNLFDVDDKCHARFDATSRTYHYIIHHAKNPFVNNMSAYMPSKIDLGLMNECCQILYRYTNYECFCKSNTQVKTFECKIEKAEWYVCGEFTIFTITADRFLRGMVRAIVGTMMNVNNRKITLNNLEEIIQSNNRRNAGKSVNPHGLYLTQVKYNFISNPVLRLPVIIGQTENNSNIK
ncbi:MAG TPA: tRNA pseudouridine(38-40) synthase TruA [Bacteroidia bacterium]|nr:tRNA pseudouridine(38-40) synthase TruA [Bacteroidota bacterium]HRC32076.1 tRNA pseudouridine(38-40) synthase TruA [Bacteroidia bacterium]